MTGHETLLTQTYTNTARRTGMAAYWFFLGAPPEQVLHTHQLLQALGIPTTVKRYKQTNKKHLLMDRKAAQQWMRQLETWGAEIPPNLKIPKPKAGKHVSPPNR